MSELPSYTTIQVSEIIPNVALVLLNRPRHMNTMNEIFFTELSHVFTVLNAKPFRAIILSSNSDTLFSAGLDLKALSALAPRGDGAQFGIHLMRLILDWQAAFTRIEQCRVPVIAAVHGPCIGGGIDLISACDIRICSRSSLFSIKEIDLAMAADLGSLQRLPKILGCHSLLREWAYTGRTIPAHEALSCGLVSHVAENREKMIEYAVELAKSIAMKSPSAIYGTKFALNYAQDHTVPDGLLQVAMWNSSQLQSSDVMKAANAILNKSVPTFSKL